MSVLAGYSLTANANERFARTALNLALSGCTVDTENGGIDFSTAADNNATIAYADSASFRIAPENPFSVHFRFRTGADVVDETFVRSSDHASLNAGWYVMANGSGQLEFNYSDAASGSSRRTWNFGTLAANTEYDVNISVVNMQGSATGVTGWINGSAVTPTTSGSSGAVVYPASVGVSFGNWARYGTARNSTHRLRKFALLDVVADATMVAQWVANPEVAMTAWNSSMALSSLPSEVRRGAAANITVASTVTTPTVGNTTVRINGSTGPLCTVNSVTGTGPYVINFTPPSGITIKHSSTGYPIHVAVDSEPAQTGNIPFLPPTGWSFVDMATVNTSASNSLANGYVSFAVATNDQCVYSSTTTPQTLAAAVSNASIASYSGTLTENNTFSYYFIRNVGTIGATSSFTFNFSSMSIDSINAGNPIANGSSYNVVMSSTTGVNSVTLNGVAQSFSITNGTTLAVAFTWPSAMYNQSIPLIVSTGTGAATAYTSVVPAGTNQVVTLDGTYSASAQGALVATPALAASDQIERQTPSSNGATYTIGPDGIPRNFSLANPGNILWRVLDASDRTLSAWVTEPFGTAGGADVTPNQFDLGANVVGAEPNAETIRSFVLTGIDSGNPVTVSGTGAGQVSLDGDTFGASVSAEAGDTIWVRGAASATYSGVVTVGASCNGVSDSFTITTMTDVGSTVIESTVNPMPSTITLSGAGATYSLAQHVVNNSGGPLAWSVHQNSPGLPAGVTLNASTGVLTFGGTTSATVNSVIFDVVPA